MGALVLIWKPFCVCWDVPREDGYGGPLDYPHLSYSILSVCALKAVELEGLVLVRVEHVNELRGGMIWLVTSM